MKDSRNMPATAHEMVSAAARQKPGVMKEKVPYLTDPAYYRLAYQLVAQQVNHAASQRDEGVNDKGKAPLRDVLEAALDTGGVVVRQANDVLATFEYRNARGRWWNPTVRPLSSREKRIRRFLNETVVPCLELVIGGGLIYTREFEMAAEHASRARERSAFSYRAYYNLACYEVSRSYYGQPFPHDSEQERQTGSPMGLELALEYLGQALRNVYGRRRKELVQWAGADPSLSLLRRSEQFGPRFDELLTRYREQSDDDIYQVSPAGDRWQVVRGGHFLSSHATKESAIEEARSAARRNAPSELIIHRRDGSEEEKRRYSRPS